MLPLGSPDAAPVTLLDYLPAETLVVLEDPALLEAPPDDAPSAAPLATLLARFQRLELPLLQRGDGGGAARLDGRALGGRLSRPVQDARDRDPRLARRGLHGAPGGGRRAAARSAAPDAGRARSRAVARGHPLEPGGARRWWWASARPGSRFPRSAWSCSARRRSSGPSGGALRRPLFQRGAAIASFNDLAPNDLVVHEQHGIAPLPRPAHAIHGRPRRRLPAAGVRRGRPPLLAGGAARPDLQVHGRARGGGAPGPAGRRRLAAPQGVGAGRAARDGRGAAQALRRRARWPSGRASPTTPPGRGSSRRSFRFEETPDQMRAIEEVKADMVGARPMDRLVAGDVGYGKTEVALRAAFRAVADGRQVAVLVPTTVLAQQHFNTFVERFAPVPGQGGAALALPQPEGAEGGGGRARHGHGGRGDRHPPAPLEGRAVQGPGPAGGGRGAPLRGHPQGAAQAAAHLGGRADAHRDPDPAHPAHGAVRRARPLGHRDAAARPAAGGDGGDRVQPHRDPRGDRAGAEPGRAGVLRPQPHPVARLHDPLHPDPGARRRGW